MSIRGHKGVKPRLLCFLFESFWVSGSGQDPESEVLTIYLVRLVRRSCRLIFSLNINKILTQNKFPMPTIWLKFGFYKYLEKMTLYNFIVFLFENAAWSRWAPSYYFRDGVSDVTTRSKTLGKCEKTFTWEVDLVDTTAFLETIHRFKYRNEKPFYNIQMRSKERKKSIKHWRVCY